MRGGSDDVPLVVFVSEHDSCVAPHLADDIVSFSILSVQDVWEEEVVHPARNCERMVDDFTTNVLLREPLAYSAAGIFGGPHLGYPVIVLVRKS
jgi:hypothetical protein